MAKATKKAAAAKPAAPVEEAPKPRLVGDEVADVGVTAAEASGDPGSQSGAGDALAHFNGRLAAFVDNLGALGITTDGHSDPFDVAIAAIVAARGRADEASAALAAATTSLFDGIKDRPDFVYVEGDGPAASAADSALRLIGALDGQVARSKGAGEQLGRLSQFLVARLGYTLPDPQKGELTDDAIIRVIGELDAEITTLTNEGETSADARKAHKAAVKGIAELFADLPDTAAITLRFAEGAEFIRQVPPIDVDRAQLLTVGSKVALDRRIDFPPAMPPAFVTHAFLIAGRKTLRCDIGPLRIGGGASAAIPAGYLEF